MEVKAKDTEVDRQQRELQTLRVRKQMNVYNYVLFSLIHTLGVRRTEKGYRQ